MMNKNDVFEGLPDYIKKYLELIPERKKIGLLKQNFSPSNEEGTTGESGDLTIKKSSKITHFFLFSMLYSSINFNRVISSFSLLLL